MSQTWKVALQSTFIFTLLFAIQSCSGSGGGAGAGDGSPSNAMTTGELATALIRQSDDNDTADDVWRCVDTAFSVRFFALGTSEGENVGILVTPTSPESDYSKKYKWEIDGSDSLTLYEPNGEFHDKYSYIVFSTERSLSLNSTAHGYLSCTYHNVTEINRISSSEITPGDALASDPMLQVVPPTGFTSMVSYLEQWLHPNGFLQYDITVEALFENDAVPISIRDVFMYGPERFVVGEYIKLDQGNVYANHEPFDLSDEAVIGSAFRAAGWLLEEGVADERIEGCFDKAKRFDIDDFGGSFIITDTYRWCFRPDGRFAISNGESLEDRKANIFQPDQYSRGRYRIDGHAIRMLFDSGFQIKSGFGWMDREENQVYILNRYPVLY